jgi:Flp pilus assembly protein TadB
MNRTATLRASDADRDAVAARLHQAAVEGRLEPEELEERLHRALRARTYGELRRLVADLPATDNARPASTGLVVAKVAFRVVLALVALAAVLTVLAVMAVWWLAWLVLWLTLRPRRGYGYGWASPRSKLRPTSIGCCTMPSFRYQAAHFSRASWRSWP